MSTITKDLGIVTAYGYAVSKGYTGTEEEFAELMASYATVAEQAAQSAETAEEAAEAAAQAVLDANAAKTAAQAAKTDAETAQGKAEEAQAKAEEAAEDLSAEGAQIETNKNDIADLKSDLNDVAKVLTNENLTWVESYGMSKQLYAVQDGNLIGSAWKSGYRVCSSASQPIYLNSGERFEIPSNRQLALAYSVDNSSGSWTDLGWVSRNYIISNTGYYLITIRSSGDSEAVGNDISAFLENVHVYNVNDGTSALGQIRSINERIHQFTGNSINMERGGWTVSATGWEKSAYQQQKRIRTATSVTLESGTRIIFPKNYRLLVGFKYSDNFYYSSEWLTADYICELTTEYVLILRTYDDSDIAETMISSIAEKIIFIIPDYNTLNKNVENDIQSASDSTSYHIIKSIARLGYNISDSSTPPENSIAGFEEAYRHGYRNMLANVRWTSDGVPVALHDRSINSVARNADGTTISDTVNIDSISLEAADSYDFGIIKGNRFAETKIMRIVDFLKWCIVHDCKPILEIKSDGVASFPTVMNKLFEVIDKYNVGNYCVFCVDDNNVTTSVHDKYPKATLAISFSDGSSLTNVFNYAATLKDENDVFVYVYAKQDFSYQITDEMIVAAVENGVDIGITECMNRYQFASFMSNSNNLAVKWLAIRDMPFSQYVKKMGY